MNSSQEQDLNGGFLLILSRDDAKSLFGCRGDQAVHDFVVSLLAKETTLALTLHDRWQPLARCFGNGSADLASGPPPLGWCFGERSMYRGIDRVIALVRPDMVAHVATALEDIDPPWLTRRFTELAAIIDPPFEMPAASVDLVPQIRDIYRQAAGTGDAVVFAVDL